MSAKTQRIVAELWQLLGQPDDDIEAQIARARFQANTMLLDMYRRMRAQPLDERIKCYGPREKYVVEFSDTSLDRLIAECEAQLNEGA